MVGTLPLKGSGPSGAEEHHLAPERGLETEDELAVDRRMSSDAVARRGLIAAGHTRVSNSQDQALIPFRRVKRMR